MAFMKFSLRFGQTIDLYEAVFRDSILASNIELSTAGAKQREQ
jgi:hypothetical protein